ILFCQCLFFVSKRVFGFVLFGPMDDVGYFSVNCCLVHFHPNLMILKYYRIDELQIEWGRPFNEVATLLEDVKKFKPYGGWPNIRCRCKNVFGLATTESEVRAPFEDRPVLQVQYELAPIKPGIFQKLHSPFMKQLRKVLGKPNRTESLYRQHKLPKRYLSSVVVYSATWIFGDVRISLSVYGDTREKDSGKAAAGIFIDWIDEKKAAMPYLEKSRTVEEMLSAKITGNMPLRKFLLSDDQHPFTVVHFELADPYIAEKDVDLRAAQMALYKRTLYQTPKYVSDQLELNEVALYSIPDLNQTFISNKWDTAPLEAEEESQLILYEILPARGPGSRQLRLNDLVIRDSRTSNALISLAEEIEGRTGLKIERKEGYDE
ncbi:MAG TPA: hypothetical protein VFR58_17005, partial [Flavisolibacter sp.]|nr:hypothetical protein [Flavisolibacter sp.]